MAPFVRVALTIRALVAGAVAVQFLAIVQHAKRGAPIEALDTLLAAGEPFSVASSYVVPPCLATLLAFALVAFWASNMARSLAADARREGFSLGPGAAASIVLVPALGGLQALRDLWRATSQADAAAWRSEPVPANLAGWCALELLQNGLAFQMLFNFEATRYSFAMLGAAHVIQAVSCFVLFDVVGEVTARFRERTVAGAAA